MQESDVLALLGEADATLDELRKLSEAPLPETLAEAVDKGIDIAIELAEGALLIHYQEDERREDRKRVIRLDDALTLLQQMEDEYLRNTVEGALRVLWGYFTFWPQIFKDALTAIWAAIVAVDFEILERAVLLLWRRVIHDWLSVIAVAEIAKPLKEILTLRSKYDRLARAKALKQRTNVKRVWRRKRTRS